MGCGYVALRSGVGLEGAKPHGGDGDDRFGGENLGVVAGGKTALCLWENSWGGWAPNNCGNGNGEATAQSFSSTYLSSTVRNGMDYVFVSWYPTQCTTRPGGSNLVPAANVKAEMQALHALYPNAKLGIGELGLPNSINGDTGKYNTCVAMANHYYGMYDDINLSYYVGAMFWWYFRQDAIPYNSGITGDFWDVLEANFNSY